MLAALAWGSTSGVRALGTVAAPASVPTNPSYLTVEMPRFVPPPPVPVAPRNHDTVLVKAPTLEVESPVTSGWFHFRVMEGPSIAAEGMSPSPAWNVGTSGRELQRGHEYHWSCRVLDVNGWSPWFEPEWCFLVGFGIQTPEPKLPQDRAVVFTRLPLLVVNPVPAEARYRFQVWDGKTLMGEGLSANPAWVYEGRELVPGNQYQWSCRAETEKDTSGWFEPLWSFEVREGQVPDGEQLAGPFDCSDMVRSGLVKVTATPNPFSGPVTFESGLEEVLRLEVYTTDGRMVRSEAAGSRPARDRQLVWDGLDQDGNALGPGTYFCRVCSGTRQEVIKLIRVN